MNRRVLLISACCVLASGRVLLVQAAVELKPPNIVLLLADDLGYGDLGCYGGPVKTPALDSLAAHGLRFTDFYAGCVVCSPSRATLLTGRQHIRTGVYSWIHDGKHKEHLLEREITLAKVLRDAGYATAHIGKWHLGLTKVTPDKFGFDDWFATENNFGLNPGNFRRNGKPVGAIDGYPCDVVVDEALRWLDKRDDRRCPFFLNLWFHEPHSPPPASWPMALTGVTSKMRTNEIFCVLVLGASLLARCVVS